MRARGQSSTRARGRLGARERSTALLCPCVSVRGVGILRRGGDIGQWRAGSKAPEHCRIMLR